ncbi:MAG: putative transcriptional regulator [Hyphomicrobiales bacterium]|nr:putative transcriptional regulator [Hyphomicrobiales bacterium]
MGSEMARPTRPAPDLDRELDDLPVELRWRTWMGRVEAVIFASSEPVSRAMLAGVVGQACRLELLIEAIRAELPGRPYELVAIAGGWQFRTKAAYGDAIRAARSGAAPATDLTRREADVLMAIAYLQPLTRAELSKVFGREISRDLIGTLRAAGFIASGPRSPQPGAPYTYVTTAGFLAAFDFANLRDLPDMAALEDAGLLNKDALLARDEPGFFGAEEEEEPDEAASALRNSTRPFY